MLHKRVTNENIVSRRQNLVFKKQVGPPQELLKSLLGHYQNGRYGDAERLAVSITQEFPKHQFGWKVLGAVLKQAGRISDYTAFFYMGDLIECDKTDTIFTNPKMKRTENYITGRFG